MSQTVHHGRALSGAKHLTQQHNGGTMDDYDARVEALRIASTHNEGIEQTIARAEAYLLFLTADAGAEYIDIPDSVPEDATGPALFQALKAAGCTSEIAKRLALTYQGVSQWKQVPAERVIAVEAITGIPRERLRPDVYGDPRCTTAAP